MRHGPLVLFGVVALLLLSGGGKDAPAPKPGGQPPGGGGGGGGGGNRTRQQRARDIAPKEPGALGVVTYPVQGGAKVVSTFGVPRPDARSHKGVDLGAPEGTPVLAMTDGDVTFGTDPLGGNIAKLTRADGSVLYYAHLSRFTGSARSVKSGDELGAVGRTGNAAATAPHLHLELWPDGTPGSAVDPMPMLSAAVVVQHATAGWEHV